MDVDKPQVVFDAYAEWWSIALGQLLRWPHVEVMRWAQMWSAHKGQGLDGIMPEVPVWYVAWALLAVSEDDDIPRLRIADAHDRVEDAIAFGELPHACYVDPDYDWDGARSRVGLVLGTYGLDLSRSSYDEDPAPKPVDWALRRHTREFCRYLFPPYCPSTMDDDEEDYRSRLKYSVEALHHLLGWPKAWALQWNLQQTPVTRKDYLSLFRSSPLDPIVNLIMKVAGEHVPIERRDEVRWAMRQAIEGGDASCSWAHRDWTSARSRLEKLLAEERMMLPALGGSHPDAR